MAYYNKDGVEIKHFEDDDTFSDFFNNVITTEIDEEVEEYDFYGNENPSFWELKNIDHFVEESWLKEHDGK